MPFTVSSANLKELASQDPVEIQAVIDDYKKETNINLVNIRDENGATLSHHLADYSSYMKYNKIRFDILTENAADFSLQDQDGNTPLHKMLLLGHVRQAHQNFDQYADYAAKNKVNFSLLNNAGHSVIHLAAIKKYSFHYESSNYIQSLINAAKKHKAELDLNVLSSNKKTALYLALAKHRINECDSLINEKVNPLLGEEKTCPRHVIETFSSDIKNLFTFIDKIQTLTKQKTDGSPDISELNAKELAAYNEYAGKHLTEINKEAKENISNARTSGEIIKENANAHLEYLEKIKSYINKYALENKPENTPASLITNQFGIHANPTTQTFSNSQPSNTISNNNASVKKI